MNEPLHTDIIERLKNDDSQVFEQVFDAFYKQLNYFAESLTGDGEEARDIVIDTFRKFWSLRHNFDTPTNIKAFLYITTRNACFNFISYRKRQTEYKKEYLDFVSSDLEAEADNALIQTEVIAMLHEEIEKLPTKCRQVVRLTLKGIPSDEIASILKVSVFTVYSQKRRARELLRTALLQRKLWWVVLLLLR